jgi:hypothetical protein
MQPDTLQTHHPQDTTNNQTLFKNITHNETLETFWLQQDEDSQDFIRSLQQMKNKINNIRVNPDGPNKHSQVFQPFVGHFAILYVAINVLQE